MNKVAITSILGTTILVAGILAFMPVEKASTQPNPASVSPLIRDNVIVNSINLAPGQVMVLVDNAGIGGTSDVEVTWRFDATKCQLARVDGTAPSITITPFGNDGALSGVPGAPAHNDEAGVDAIVLTTQSGQTCKIDPDKGQFITVSTVGSSP